MSALRWDSHFGFFDFALRSAQNDSARVAFSSMQPPLPFTGEGWSESLPRT